VFDSELITYTRPGSTVAGFGRQGHATGKIIRRLLGRVPGWADYHAGAAPANHPCALLHHVAQLVGDQLSPTAGTWLIRAAFEKDICSGGKGLGLKLLVENIGPSIRMHTHPTEIVAHRLTHLRLDRAVQGLPAAAGAVDGRLDLWRHRAALDSYPLYAGFGLEHFLVQLLPLEGLHLQKLFILFLALYWALAVGAKSPLGQRGGANNRCPGRADWPCHARQLRHRPVTHRALEPQHILRGERTGSLRDALNDRRRVVQPAIFLRSLILSPGPPLLCRAFVMTVGLLF
jgi:hypothetical protein